MPGGFLGVDIFFVISGYLITGIIQQQLHGKRFSLADFYARRIRRILPVLIGVVAATFAADWFLLPLRDMQSLGGNIAGGAVFAQNFILLGQVGYFDVAAERKPLLHLWSLGIEEQSYLVWPWIMLALRRWHFNGVAVVAVLAVMSFALCLIVGARAPDAAFYLPATRAWELLRADLRRTAALVKPLTNKLVVMGLFATWIGAGLPENILDYYFEGGRSAILPERTWYRSNDNWSGAVESILQPEAAALGIDYIPVRKLMCNADGCIARIGPNGSEPMTYDGCHLTKPGAVFLTGLMIDQLLAGR